MLQHGLLERAPSSSLPPALSYIARKRVHMHVDIWAHMSTSVHTVCRSCPWPSSGPMSAKANSLVYPQEDTVVKKRPLQAWKQFGKAIPEAREPEIRSREGAQLSLGVSLWSCWLLMLWRGMWLGEGRDGAQSPWVPRVTPVMAGGRTGILSQMKQNGGGPWTFQNPQTHDFHLKNDGRRIIFSVLNPIPTARWQAIAKSRHTDGEGVLEAFFIHPSRL